MDWSHPASLGRRAFVAGCGLLAACNRSARATATASPAATTTARASTSALAAAPASAAPSPSAPASAAALESLSPSTHALFDAYPALAERLPRVALARFPSLLERAPALAPDAEVWIKRDDDFTLGAAPASPSPSPSAAELAALFGGGKIRKLELCFGEARAQGKRRIVTSGGIGSNQALAVALLGKALGFSVRLHLTPQPLSALTSTNLRADAAADAELRLFATVFEGHSQAMRDAKDSTDTYVIPPGATTPLGTLGFVSAGLELARDVHAGRMAEPTKLYVALGLGGGAAGLALGCALGELRTEIIGVRASSPGTVTGATLRAIHDETVRFARARDDSFPALPFASASVRIEGRFVGSGYGAPSAAGADAIARARESEGWELDPVYTGKALAALLDDVRREPHPGGARPRLFWNTMSSRPLSLADVPPAFQKFLR